ncbi:MAG TPA: nucleotide exchange factor GrpE [Erysipelothrix sp.]|nr:nucleotide exchange factor GrpE [Erysipelothrix sp.]
MSKETLNTIVDEEVEVTEEENEETVEEELDEVALLQKENEALKEEVVKLKNDYFKAYADAENIRKRQQRDYELSMKYRIQTFAHDILPAIDNLERALAQEKSEETASYREGVEMIYEQVLSALKAEGVEPIKALGKKFDPNIHQALQTEEVKGKKKDIVLEEYQKGYMIKDRVLRASLVKVSQ